MSLKGSHDNLSIVLKTYALPPSVKVCILCIFYQYVIYMHWVSRGHGYQDATRRGICPGSVQLRPDVNPRAKQWGRDAESASGAGEVGKRQLHGGCQGQ